MSMSIEDFMRLAAQAEDTLQSKAAVTTDTYSQLKAEFSAIPLGPTLGPGGGLTKNKDILQISPSGKIMYVNGAIYDPESGQTYYPPNPSLAAGIPGSDAWIADIQENWSEEKANEWRKKLWEQGYEAVGLAAKTGGWGHDLIAALKAYHNNRYANQGKVVPLAPGGGDIGTREAIRKGTDFKAIKEEVRGWGEVAFGEPLNDDEAEYFAERTRKLMFKLGRKHPEWSLEQIQSGASLRAQEEFVEAPGVKGALKDAEEDEMDETLLNSIVSISQLGSI